MSKKESGRRGSVLYNSLLFDAYSWHNEADGTCKTVVGLEDCINIIYSSIQPSAPKTPTYPGLVVLPGPDRIWGNQNHPWASHKGSNHRTTLEARKHLRTRISTGVVEVPTTPKEEIIKDFDAKMQTVIEEAFKIGSRRRN